jgi:hypothetical protein
MEIKTQLIMKLANDGIALAQAAKQLSKDAKSLDQSGIGYAADRLAGEVMENIMTLPIVLIAKEEK